MMNQLNECSSTSILIQLKDRIILMIDDLRTKRTTIYKPKTILNLLRHCDFILVSLQNLKEHLTLEGKQLKDKVFLKDVDSLYPKTLLSLKNLKEVTSELHQGDIEGRDINDVYEDIIKHVEEIVYNSLSLFVALDKACLRRIDGCMDLTLDLLSVLVQSSSSNVIDNFRNFVESLLSNFELVRARSCVMNNRLQKQALNILSLQLFKIVPLLSFVLISSFRYPSCKGYQLMCNFVVAKMRELITRIQNELGSCSSQYELQDPGIYVNTLDQIFNLVTLKAGEKGIDRLPLIGTLKPLIEIVLQHSLCIAQCSSPDNHSQILAASENVLQQMKILSQMEGCENPNSADMDILLDVIVDAVEIVEVKVNLALINLIVEVFTEPFVNLDSLLNIMKTQNTEAQKLSVKSLVSIFEEEVDKIYNIGGFIISCINDVARVREIESALSLLMWLESGLIAAVLKTSETPFYPYSYIYTLASQWKKVLEDLRNSVYQLLEIDALCKVTKRQIHIVWAEMRDCLNSKDKEWFRRKVKFVVSLTDRLIKLNDDQQFLNEKQSKDIEQVIIEIEKCGEEVMADNLDEKSTRRLFKRIQVLLTSISRISYMFDNQSLPEYENPSEVGNYSSRKMKLDSQEALNCEPQTDDVLLSKISDVSIDISESANSSFGVRHGSKYLNFQENETSLNSIFKDKSKRNLSRSRRASRLSEQKTISLEFGENKELSESAVSIDITRFLSKSVNNFRNSSRASKRNFSLKVREVNFDIGDIIKINTRPKDNVIKVDGDELSKVPGIMVAHEFLNSKSFAGIDNEKPFQRSNLFYRTFHGLLPEKSSSRKSSVEMQLRDFAHLYNFPNKAQEGNKSELKLSVIDTSGSSASNVNTEESNHLTNVDTAQRLQDLKVVKQKIFSIKSLFKIDL